jgi:hypothetical protein
MVPPLRVRLAFKMRCLFWPYLRLLLAFGAGWAVLNASLLGAVPLFEPPGRWWAFALPAAGAAGLVRWQLWPRLGVVRENRRSSRRFLLAMVAGSVLTTVANTGYQALFSALGRYAFLRTVADLPRHPGARYFQVGSLFLDHAHVGTQTITALSGKHGETLTYSFYQVCPLLPAPTYGHPNAPVTVWLGLEYSYSMPSDLPQPAQDTAYEHFLSRCDARYSRDLRRRWTYLERAPRRDSLHWQPAVRRNPRFRAGAVAPLVLLPRYAPLSARAALAWRQAAGIALGGSALVLLLVLLFPLRPEVLQALAPARPR